MTRRAPAAPRLDRGRVVLATLDPTSGHEQQGTRPCVIISDPEAANDQRFPLVCIVPVTGTPSVGLLYPELHPGRSGLRKPSYALVDQLRSIDKSRIRGHFGAISGAELDAIDAGLRLYLGLEEQSAESAE